MISFKLSRFTTLNDRIGQKLISARFGLSLREFRTVGTIAYLGPVTASTLARESFLDHAQVGRIIGTLIGKRLIERVGSNGRGGVLQLTDAGADMMEEGVRFSRDHNRLLLAHLPEEDQGHLVRIVDRLLDHAQDRYGRVNGEIAEIVQELAPGQDGPATEGHDSR